MVIITVAVESRLSQPVCVCVRVCLCVNYSAIWKWFILFNSVWVRVEPMKFQTCSPRNKQLFTKRKGSPGRCGSISWSVILWPKGYGFYSWSGHIPRLQVWSSILDCWSGNPQSPVLAGMEAASWCLSLASMFLSLPSSLSKSNEKKMSSGDFWSKWRPR